MRCRGYRSWGDALDRNLKEVNITITPEDLRRQRLKKPRHKVYIINYETNELVLVKDTRARRTP